MEKSEAEAIGGAKVRLMDIPEEWNSLHLDAHMDKKLAHSKSLKKALMQDLLTGKVRVRV